MSAARPAAPRRPPAAAALAAALALALLFLLARNMGLFPAIFADEWYYSSFARLIPLREVPVPSYLYFALYRLSNSCGSGFLECARLLNSVLFVAAALPIYLIARPAAGRRRAALVAVLAVLAPINIYTAYFMPEAAYFLAFWVFSWSALRCHRAPTPANIVLASALLALASLVKIHALFLLPGWCAFLAHAAHGHHGRAGAAAWLRAAALWIGLALATAALLRAGLGYLAAGPRGLNLLGSLYGTQAAQSQAHRPGLGQLLPLMLANLRGHLLGLALLFGVPLAGLAAHGLDAGRRPAGADPRSALAVYLLLTAAALLAVTVGFTASVAGQGPYETAARLHMRYYNFIFPLFLLWAAAQAGAGAAPAPRWRWPIGLALAALLLYAYLDLPRHYTPNYVDSPELEALTFHRGGFALLAGVALLSLAGWLRDARLGARLFLFVFTPLLALAAAVHLHALNRNWIAPDAYMRGGQFAHLHLTPAEAARLTVVGADAAGLFKSRFFVDNPATATLELPAGGTVDLAALAPRTRWLLLIGDYVVPANTLSHLRQRDYALLQIVEADDAPHLVDFSAALPDDYLVKAGGLSGAEPFGRWSDGKTVTLELAAPLPRQFDLSLTAHAFAGNQGRPFTVRVGEQQQALVLGATPQRRTLRFTSDGKQTTIRIGVPQPVSPQALGQGADQRQLGIALQRMEVAPLAPAR